MLDTVNFVMEWGTRHRGLAMIRGQGLCRSRRRNHPGKERESSSSGGSRRTRNSPEQSVDQEQPARRNQQEDKHQGLDGKGLRDHSDRSWTA